MTELFNVPSVLPASTPRRTHAFFTSEVTLLTGYRYRAAYPGASLFPELSWPNHLNLPTLRFLRR